MRISFKKIITQGNLIKLVVGAVAFYIIYNAYHNTYEHQIESQRTEKDHHFRTSINSPIEDKEKFQGLNYFPVNPSYKIKAAVQTLSTPETIEMLSSDGKRIDYLKFAVAIFKLNNKEYRLTLLKHGTDDNILFLPFTDKTNGEETYQSGRYLDVVFKTEKDVIIDFNLAYHPYCVYSYRYSCPIPPPENYLDILIPAGERLSIHSGEKR